jgi:hypothetical protein
MHRLENSILSLALLSIPLCLSAEEQELEVLIRAWADPSYIRQVDATGQTQVESCTFYPGNYHPGAYETTPTPFEEVATILRKHLESQNYTMAPEPAAADLLLVVNWGQTGAEEDEAAIEIDGDDGTLSSGLGHLDDHSERAKARLIGANKLFDMHPGLLKRRMLEEAVRQERYFINIIAYSLDEIRLRPDKDRLPEAKWITVMSVPSKHIDPERGFTALSETASNYFGRNLADLTFFREGDKQGIVTIGEIRFLDFKEPEPEAAAE